MEKFPRIEEDCIKIKKWKDTRFWAIWINQELLAVTVYKKGALAIKELILSSK